MSFVLDWAVYVSICNFVLIYIIMRYPVYRNIHCVARHGSNCLFTYLYLTGISTALTLEHWEIQRDTGNDYYPNDVQEPPENIKRGTLLHSAAVTKVFSG